MNDFDKIGVTLGERLLRNRFKVIVLVLLTLAAAVSGVQYLGFNTNYRVFFGADNPQLQDFDQLQKVYTKTDSTVFVLKPKDGDVFSRDVLSAVKELTEGSWKLPYSSRVDSLSNYQHTSAEGDDLTVRDLVAGDPQELTDDELEYIRKVSLNEPLLLSRIVSPDSRATGVATTFYLDADEPMQTPEAIGKARELLDSVQAKYPNIEMRGSGMVYMNNAFSEASQTDIETLIPIMYLVMIIAMLAFLRSISATIATVFVILFSAVATMGLAGWVGIELTPPSASAPTIILTLAIADSIHIIVSMLKQMQRGMTKNEAIIESLRINFQPVFLTSATTAIGFLSLNFSDAPPFQDLGNMVAVGIILAFVYSVTLLPVLLSVLPIKARVKSEEKIGNSSMNKFASFIINQRKKVFFSSVAVVLVLGYMISKIELNDQFVQYFDHSISFRGDTEFMIDNLTGVYQLEYSVGAKEEHGITDPEYLTNLDSFAEWLRAQPEVMNVYSMTDIFKRLNKNMHGDDESWYKIPETREMAAQYFLLYEFSLPYGLDMNDRVNINKSATRLTATTIDMTTNDFRALKDKSEQWLRDNTPEYMHTGATSPMVMFAYISERNINSMMVGNAIALLLISVLIMVALKSVRIGAYSLVPNIVPAIMGFGIWGLFIGEINMAVAIIAAISLGIIVDDTVHFLSKYFRARREKGMSAEEAVRYSFNMVGTALLVTTLVIIAGFSVLLFSNFQMNEVSGLLTAIIIGCALLADFFLLPPMLMYLDNKDDKAKESHYV